MGSNTERAKKAIEAMKTLGFSKKMATAVLRDLVKLYGNNWELIEDENYRAFADAILDRQEKDERKPAADEEMGVVDEESQCHSAKRAMPEDQEASASASGYGMDNETPLIKRPRSESSNLREEQASELRNCRGKSIEPAVPQSTEEVQDGMVMSPRGHGPASADLGRRETRSLTRARQAVASPQKVSSAIVTYKRTKEPVHDNSHNALSLKEPKPEPGIDDMEGADGSRSQDAAVGLIAEPLNIDSSRVGVTLALACPNQPYPENTGNKNRGIQHCRTRKISTSRAHVMESTAKQDENQENGTDHAVTLCKPGSGSAVANIPDVPCTDLDIASSTMGEVKMSLKCNADGSKFRMPSLEAVFKMVEDKCLRSYKILPPDFSIGSLMNEICQCVVELGNVHTADSNVNSGVDASSLQEEPMAGNVPFVKPIASQNDGSRKENVANESSVLEAPDNGLPNSIVPQQPLMALSELRPTHDVTDISRGEERVRIPVVNEFGSEKYPSSFYYVPRNLVFQNAYVSISLARIGDEDSCPDCFDNCLSAPVPCACARETGGEFAYTPEGLLRTSFLEQCVSMNRFPEKHHKFYCKACPLEKSKNEASPDPCKGHLVRKFIKECWSKCGCNMQCGNRVVQRGITSNLQVFFTPEGKGWGLRTLDELPKGTFVCEYVGEILTNVEFHKRMVASTANARHMYPVLLDADWGAEGVMKDEEALCLDATFYGNVGRFVNHRCYDSNLVEIPVEVETPDHHYYHLAFFTSKKVEAFEELTWDYGIDFDETCHPVKSFRCLCGSRYCRDLKHSRKRGKAISK